MAGVVRHSPMEEVFVSEGLLIEAALTDGGSLPERKVDYRRHRRG